MSKLASKIAATPVAPSVTRRGPANVCGPVYGPGDLEDWDAIEALRPTLTWRELQAHVDQMVGVEKPLPLEKFRYHWRRRCFCWPEGLRR